MKSMVNSMTKVNDREAMWIMVVSSVGLSKKRIADRYRFKYMDVVNVLRGNSFSNITGILHHSITSEEITVVKRLLNQKHPYREIARYAGIESNKVRNIMGVMQSGRVI